MADKSTRESYFPAIEKKYGEPMSYWFAQMKKVVGKKYPEQISFLRENFGFSQTHANALVMYTRGSTTSRRFANPTDFLASLDKDQAKLVRKIIRIVQKKFPKLELVMAWNQPMFRSGKSYVFGCSVAKNHILIAPYDAKVIKKLAPLLTGYEVNKKTVRVPNNWKVDEKLLFAMIRETLKSSKSK